MEEEKIVLYASKIRAVLSSIILILLLGIFVFLLFNKVNTEITHKIVGFIGTVLFLPIVVITIRYLFSKKPILIVDEKGITTNSLFTSYRFIPWNDVREMSFRMFDNNPKIQIYINNEEEYIERVKGWRRKLLQISKMIDCGVYISVEFSGVKTEDILQKMQKMHKKYRV